MNVLWYEGRCCYLFSLQPLSAHPGWLKTDMKGGKLDQLKEAMREASASPHATYLDMERLLERLALSYGVKVGRDRISGKAMQEFALAKRAIFLQEARLSLDYNKRDAKSLFPQELKDQIQTLIQDNLLGRSYSPLSSQSCPPDWWEFHPYAAEVLSNDENLKYRLFAQDWCFTLDHYLPCSEVKQRLIKIMEDAGILKDLKIEVKGAQAFIGMVFYMRIWWKAHLHRGTLVRHST